MSKVNVLIRKRLGVPGRWTGALSVYMDEVWGPYLPAPLSFLPAGVGMQPEAIERHSSQLL